MLLLPNTRCTARLEQGDRIIPVVIESGTGTSSVYLCRTASGELLQIHESSLKPMPPTIPPRFKQKLFNSVAPHIGACLANWPNVVTIEPDSISPDTLSRRIRDAFEAKRRYNYFHHSINEDKYRLHAHEITVSITFEEGKVALGSESAINLNKSSKDTSETKRTNYIYVDCTNPQFTESFFLLLHNKLFNPAPSFIATNLTLTQAASLESRYDIGLNPTEENINNYVVIL